MKPTKITRSLKAPKEGGFTLFEILIALFIFAIVASLMFTSFTGTLRIIDETESQADVYAMARITLERIIEDLESLYTRPEGTPPASPEEQAEPPVIEGKDKEIDGRSADTLQFFSRAHLVFDGEDENSGVARIMYYLDEGAEGEGLILYRSDTAASTAPLEEETGGLVLCEGLYSLDFTYHDAEGEAYKNWDSSDETFKGKIPARITIALEYANKSNPEAPVKFIAGVALPLARETNGKPS